MIFYHSAEFLLHLVNHLEKVKSMRIQSSSKREVFLKRTLPWIIPLPLDRKQSFNPNILSCWYFLGVFAGILLALVVSISSSVGASGGLFSTILFVFPAVSLIYGGIGVAVLKAIRLGRPSVYPGYFWWLLPILGPITSTVGVLLIVLFFFGVKRKKRIPGSEVEEMATNSTLEETFEQYGTLLKMMHDNKLLDEEEAQVYTEIKEAYEQGRNNDSELLKSKLQMIFQEEQEEIRKRKLQILVRIFLKMLTKLGCEIV